MRGGGDRGRRTRRHRLASRAILTCLSLGKLYIHVCMYACISLALSRWFSNFARNEGAEKNAYARGNRAPQTREETDDAAESCLCSTLAPSIRRRFSFYARRRSLVRSFVRSFARLLAHSRYYSLARYVSCLLTYTIFVLTLPPPVLLPPSRRQFSSLRVR